MGRGAPRAGGLPALPGRPKLTISVAWRNTRSAKTRVMFSAAGVAVATLLLTFVLATYRGWNDGLGTYIDQTQADVWVAPLGSEGFFTPAIVSRSFISSVQELPGVSEVHTLLYRPAKLRFDGQGFDTWVVGVPDGGPGGPVRMKEGNAKPTLGEIVLDDVQARLAGIEIGDQVDLAGSMLKVVGISKGGNVVFAQIAFISEAEARAEFRKAVEDAALPSIPPGLDPEKSINLMLVKTAPGRAADVAAAVNKNVPGVNAFVTKDFADNSKRALKQAILPILVVILALAFLVGTLVLGLTVYTSVLEKEREFGVLKAVGTPRLAILRVVLEQALVCSVLGFAAGLAVTFVAARIVAFAVPQFITSFYVADLVLVFGASIAMTVFASLVPALKVIRSDALTVFKA